MTRAAVAPAPVTPAAGTRAPAEAPDGAPVRVTDRCTGCGACLLTCPQRAIRPVGGALHILADACDGCGECVEVCPADAIDEVAVPGAGAAAEDVFDAALDAPDSAASAPVGVGARATGARRLSDTLSGGPS